jgi:hypothetical protein
LLFHSSRYQRADNRTWPTTKGAEPAGQGGPDHATVDQQGKYGTDYCRIFPKKKNIF